MRNADKILDYIEGTGLNEPYPVRALYPPINPGEKDWQDYYRVRNLNQPNHYHNGGAWPFIGGFYVAALVKAGRLDQAAYQLEKLAQMNRLGKKTEWEFNEWAHGKTGRPMGKAYQAWSAASFVAAHLRFQGDTSIEVAEQRPDEITQQQDAGLYQQRPGQCDPLLHSGRTAIVTPIQEFAQAELSLSSSTRRLI